MSLQELQEDLDEIREVKDMAIAMYKKDNKEYEEKVECVTTTIKEAIAAQKSNFGSSYGYGYGMSSGPRGGQRKRMVGYRSPSRRAPRARGTTAKRRKSPMMY